jgi:hypothetical protein
MSAPEDHQTAESRVIGLDRVVSRKVEILGTTGVSHPHFPADGMEAVRCLDLYS